VFESYLAPAAGVTTHRDLASLEIWEISLERSLRRRELAAMHRKAAPKTKGATVAVTAALLVSPLLSASSASARGSGAATAAATRTQLPRPRHADGAIVKRGDTGGTVAKVQRALKIADDGIFGPLTARAVSDFQLRAKVHRSGRVDRSTWKALFSAARSSSGAGAAGSAGESPASGGAAPVTSPAAPATPATPAQATPAPAVGTCPTTIVAPLKGTLTSGFGDGRHHQGVDLAAPIGTAVHAAACGIVTTAESESGYGNIVCIRHSSALTTCYAHLSSMAVALGTYVQQGRTIGRVGMTGHTTGPHVHFETRVNGTAQDPAPFLAGTRAIPGTPVTDPTLG
jgi:murein DD-endopeptidase MepM/ murein hydrolase activator NlpD